MWNACINHEIKQCKTIIRFWNRARNYETAGFNMFTLVNDLSDWAAQFVTINVDGIVTSNDTRVVIHLNRPSRIHSFPTFTFHNSTEPTYHMLSRGCSVELWNVHYYTDTMSECLLELGSLVTSHVYFNLSISDVTFDGPCVALKGQRLISPSYGRRHICTS